MENMSALSRGDSSHLSIDNQYPLRGTSPSAWATKPAAVARAKSTNTDQPAPPIPQRPKSQRYGAAKAMENMSALSRGDSSHLSIDNQYPFRTNLICSEEDVLPGEGGGTSPSAWASKPAATSVARAKIGEGKPAVVSKAKKSRNKRLPAEPEQSRNKQLWAEPEPESVSWALGIGKERRSKNQGGGKRSGGDDGLVENLGKSRSILAGYSGKQKFWNLLNKRHDLEENIEEARDAVSSLDAGSFLISEATSGTTSKGGTVLGRKLDCPQDGTVTAQQQTDVDAEVRARARKWEEYKKAYPTQLCLVQHFPARERSLRKSSKWQEGLIDIFTHPADVQDMLEAVYDFGGGGIDLVAVFLHSDSRSLFWSLVYHFHPCYFHLGGTLDSGHTPSEQMLVSALPHKEWSHLKHGRGRKRKPSEKAKINSQQQPQPSPRCYCPSCNVTECIINKSVSTMLRYANDESETKFLDQADLDQLGLALRMPLLVCSTLQHPNHSVDQLREAKELFFSFSLVKKENGEDEEHGQKTWIAEVINDLDLVVALVENQRDSCKCNDLKLVKASLMMLIGVAISMGNNCGLRGVDGGNCVDAIDCFGIALNISKEEKGLYSDLLAITSTFLIAREVIAAPINDKDVSFCLMECGYCGKCNSLQDRAEKFLSLQVRASQMLRVFVATLGGDKDLNVNMKKAFFSLIHWRDSNQILMKKKKMEE